MRLVLAILIGLMGGALWAETPGSYDPLGQQPEIVCVDGVCYEVVDQPEAFSLSVPPPTAVIAAPQPGIILSTGCGCGCANCHCGQSTTAVVSTASYVVQSAPVYTSARVVATERMGVRRVAIRTARRCGRLQGAANFAATGVSRAGNFVRGIAPRAWFNLR